MMGGIRACSKVDLWEEVKRSLMFNRWPVRSWFSVHVAWKGRARTNQQRVLEADVLPSKGSKSANVCLKEFLRHSEV